MQLTQTYSTKATETPTKHTAHTLSLVTYQVLGKLPEISTHQEDRHRGTGWLYRDILHYSHMDYLDTHQYLLHSEHL